MRTCFNVPCVNFGEVLDSGDYVCPNCGHEAGEATCWNVAFAATGNTIQDHILSRDEAVALAKSYTEDGYQAVVIPIREA